jgi:3-hydroxybutyryl-CoA dehydrogenase
MGRGIAQVAAVAGLRVRLFDSSAQATADAIAFISGMLTRAVEKGRLSESEAEKAAANIASVARLEDLSECQVVVEAIVEKLEAKQQLFVALEQIVGETCILATNTSSLSVTAIAAKCRLPARVAGFHFFNPVPLMKVVEVISGIRTEPEVCTALAALASRMGHDPVRAKDSPGFLINHAGRGYGTEALRILSEGVATVTDIDRVMREAAHFPLGPFELLDLTGLDVSDPVMRSIYHQFYEEPRFRPSPETARRVSAELLGRKSGEGFYRYESGRPVLPDDPLEDGTAPARVWISSKDAEACARLAALLEPSGVPIETSGTPSADALCLVTPFGEDCTAAALDRNLDPRRTLAVDMLLPESPRITVMANPATAGAWRDAAKALLRVAGRKATLIADSPGFIAQRILASIVNVACEIAQQRIATPEDIDVAVRLGLGYPEGPLAWGDRLGSARILRILEGLHDTTGDPRYRPSLWLRRRTQLGLPLTAPDLAD